MQQHAGELRFRREMPGRLQRVINGPVFGGGEAVERMGGRLREQRLRSEQREEKNGSSQASHRECLAKKAKTSVWCEVMTVP